MRIVSLAPSNTEILFALGVGSQIVGVTAFCDYPEKAKKLPQVGGWTTANIHKVLELKPDLVITSTFLQKDAPERFKDLPFKLLHVDPQDLASVYDSFVQIGEAVGRKRQAKALLTDMKKSILNIPKIPNNSKPRIYIEEWHKPPMVSGNWVPELVEIAGGKYFPIKPGEPSREVTLEEIQAFNPEIIILSLCGFGKRPSQEIITKREDWENLAAVRNNQVYVVDDSLFNRPSLRLTEGIDLLKEIIKG